MWKGKLLSVGTNAKTVKGDKASEYLTAIMYLAPADLGGMGNVCAFAVMAGCKDPCLNLSGRSRFNNVQLARIRKTRWFFQDRQGFIGQLETDIASFVKHCNKVGKKPAVRLNGTSDIMWEAVAPQLFTKFPKVQYYDYTKVYKRAYAKLPDNYHLTLSYSGANPEYAEAVRLAHVKTGVNMAVVYRTKELRQVSGAIDGDETDLRFLDPHGVIVGLYAKGKAKHDKSGFVVD